MPLLPDIAGREFEYHLYLQMNNCVRILIASLVFLIPLKKKNHAVFRTVLAVLMCVAAFFVFAWIRCSADTLFTRFFVGTCKYALPILIILTVAEGGLLSRFRVICASIAAGEIANCLYYLLLMAAGGDERITISLFRFAEETTVWEWLVFFAITTLFVWLLFLLFRYNRFEELDEDSRGSTLYMMTICLLFHPAADCLRTLLLRDDPSSLLMYRLHIIAVSLFILYFCNDLSFRSKTRTEKLIMDQVLAEERKRYFQLKENIDLINMRCHDLRHQLDDFAGRLTDREIAELREAMEFYDSNIRTGSEVLDVVLRINQLACQKENIQLSCLADGACLGFMRTRDIYTLFNNALSNAMEAVRKLDDPEKRVISLTVVRKKDRVEIELTNYFDGTVVQIGETTKQDAHHHGFGTMSMRYIAENYGGSISMQTQKDVFTLLIAIPLS